MKRGQRKLWRDLAAAATAVAESKNYAEEYMAGVEFTNVMRRLLPGTFKPLNEPGATMAETSPAGGSGHDSGSLSGEPIEWQDVCAGDQIELKIFSLKFGPGRESRWILEVNWPLITLTGDPDDPERVYTIDATMTDRFDRHLRLLQRRG